MQVRWIGFAHTGDFAPARASGIGVQADRCYREASAEAYYYPAFFDAYYSNHEGTRFPS
jgi:hypothetical protein